MGNTSVDTTTLSIDLGGMQVDLLSDGQLWLDGGAMYGITPKTVWSKLQPPDEQNRIALGLNCLLVRQGDRTLLVEGGIGEGHPEKFVKIFRIEREKSLLQQLEERQIGQEDIDALYLTHVHFDHAGWITRPEAEAFVPTFPNARFAVQKDHWEAAMSPHRTVTASFLQERLSPWVGNSQLDLLKGSGKIDDGVEALLTEGHTAGHQSILLRGEKETLCFVGDLIPTPYHLTLSHIMAYDRHPEKTLDNKTKLLQQAAEEGWILVFPHDPVLRFARVTPDGQGEYQVSYLPKKGPKHGD